MSESLSARASASTNGMGSSSAHTDDWVDRSYCRWSSGLEGRAAAVNNSRLKRALDVVLASGLAVALLPALFLIAFAIAVESPGSPIFRQERYGKERKVFWVYKFRTMRVSEASGVFTQATRGDRRLTRLGVLLRRTSIDEIPQLLNVLTGEMSLVGPRPHARTMDDLFASSFEGYSTRHMVRPGMTGLAQVCGYRGPTETRAAMAERLHRDREYIQDWSFWLDLKILARTPFALIHENAV